MKPITKFILKVLICGIVSWFVSGWLLISFSYLHPVYFNAEIYNENQQTLFFTPSDLHFPSLIKIQRQTTLLPDKWQKVSIPIPRHWASRLHLGFAHPRGTTIFRKVTLHEQPFDLASASHYQMRNVRSCDRDENSGEVSCRVAGERAVITLPPKTVQALFPALWPWRVIFFIFSFLICLILYKRYQRPIFLFLQKYYPNWLIGILFLLVIYSYCAMRWYTFSARLEAVFFMPSWPQFFLLLQEHAWMLAVFFGTAALAFTLRQKWLKGLLILGSFILLFAEIIDGALLQLLNIRFIPEQIRHYAIDTLLSIGPFVKSYLASPTATYTLILLGSWTVICIYAWKFQIHKQIKYVLYTLAIFGLIWYLLPVAMTPAERMQMQDLPRFWLRSKLPIKGTSPLTATDFHLNYQCQDGLNSRQHIIIILIESLSSYMSEYFSNGKLENWTPQLDQLARRYTAFTNYRTTNPDTTQALFSIFTGIPAVHFYAENNLYREPKFYYRTLAKTFHQAGYHTAFFTSASWVYSKDEILKRAGFDEISKDTDPFYDAKKRFVFHSVSDDVLYANAEQWMENYKLSNPYLLVLETTTTHNPFIDPKTGEESLENSIRYADQALGDFIKQLKDKNLLDNTLVVITSDHRAMLPLTAEQSRVFGKTAEASIPFVIIGSPLKTDQHGVFSHTDLAPSLEYLTLPQACWHDFQQNMFAAQTQRTSCTIFCSLIHRHQLQIDCQGQYAQINMYPHFNRLAGGTISPGQKDSLLGFINWIRDNNRY